MLNNNWYAFYKTAQSYDAVYINEGEISALQQLNFLPDIPGNYKGFYYLLPISQLSDEQKQAWMHQTQFLDNVSMGLYNNIVNALQSNNDMSIIGLRSGDTATRQHEDIHHKMDQGADTSRLEMMFHNRSPEEVQGITDWLGQHGYESNEIPGEYYAYILSDPSLVQSEQFRLNQDEFTELRNMGLNVPDEAAKSKPQDSGIMSTMPTM